MSATQTPPITLSNTDSTNNCEWTLCFVCILPVSCVPTVLFVFILCLVYPVFCLYSSCVLCIHCFVNTNKTKEKQQRKLKRWATQTPPINVSNTDSTNNCEWRHPPCYMSNTDSTNNWATQTPPITASCVLCTHCFVCIHQVSCVPIVLFVFYLCLVYPLFCLYSSCVLCTQYFVCIHPVSCVSTVLFVFIKQNSGYTRHRMNTNKTVGTQDTGWIQTKQWVHKTPDEYKQNSGYTRHRMNTNKSVLCTHCFVCIHPVSCVPIFLFVFILCLVYPLFCLYSSCVLYTHCFVCIHPLSCVPTVLFVNSGYTRHRMNTNKTVGTQDTVWIQTKHWVHKTQDEYKQSSGYTRPYQGLWNLQTCLPLQFSPTFILDYKFIWTIGLICIFSIGLE
jgi:hypothetical protein